MSNKLFINDFIIILIKILLHLGRFFSTISHYNKWPNIKFWNRNMNTRWIEVFRAGKQTDSAGNTKDWTTEDLDTIVKTYNDQPAEARHEAPVVLGHPETDKPAYGWVQQLKREGNTLLAELKDLSDNFVEMVKNGMYKKRSISLYADMLLKHVGFLGAVPPAVKGLADPVFNHEGVSTTIEFEEEKIEFKEELTNFSIKLELTDEVKNYLTNTEEKLMNQFNKLTTWLKDKFSEDESATKVIEAVANYSEDTPAPAPTIKSVDFKESDEYKQMLAKQQESDARIAKMQEDARRKDWDNFCDGIINTALTPTETKAAKLLPASVASVKIMANTLYSQFTAEFSETVKIDETPAAKALSSFLEGLPDQKLFGTQAGKEGREDVVTRSEFANANCDEADLAFFNKVKAVEKEKNISFTEALDIVRSEEV